MRGTLPQRSFCWRCPRGTPSFMAAPARRASPAPHCAAPSAWDGASLATAPLLQGDPPSEHPPQGCRTVPPRHPKPVETCSGDVVPLRLVLPSCFRGSHIEVPSFLQAPSGARTSSRAGSWTSKGSTARAQGSVCGHAAASPGMGHQLSASEPRETCCSRFTCPARSFVYKREALTLASTAVPGPPSPREGGTLPALRGNRAPGADARLSLIHI